MHLPDVTRIAVLRANGIGDLMFALPALAALRAAYPVAHITLLGARHHAALLDGRPSPVDRVIVVPPARGVNEVDGAECPEALDRFFAAMQNERFDLALQMHGGGRFSNPFTRRLGARVTVGLKADDAPPLDRWIPYTYWQPEVARYLEVVSLVGAAPHAIAPQLAVTARDLEEAERLVPSTDAPVVLLNPGGTDPRRRWPEERFAEVGDALAAEGARIVVNGSGGEREITERVMACMDADAADVAGHLSLGGLVGLASRCSVVISNDSGPLYVSAAAGAPTVGIYWCGNLATSGMLTRARHRPVASWQLECSVCGAHCVYANCTHRPSFVSHVTTHDVLAAVEDVWRGRKTAVSYEL
ncbi:MAG TPA: glycosyltransferase family 9 protein [Gemmatimonadaceae bacterium]